MGINQMVRHASFDCKRTIGPPNLTAKRNPVQICAFAGKLVMTGFFVMTPIDMQERLTYCSRRRQTSLFSVV